MGHVLTIQRIFISKWSFVAIVLFSGLCVWTELINWFPHTPEHQVSVEGAMGAGLDPSTASTLDPRTVQSLWMALYSVVLWGGEKCRVNAEKCLKDVRDTALLVLLPSWRNSREI